MLIGPIRRSSAIRGVQVGCNNNRIRHTRRGVDDYVLVYWMLSYVCYLLHAMCVCRTRIILLPIYPPLYKKKTLQADNPRFCPVYFFSLSPCYINVLLSLFLLYGLLQLIGVLQSYEGERITSAFHYFASIYCSLLSFIFTQFVWGCCDGMLSKSKRSQSLKSFKGYAPW